MTIVTEIEDYAAANDIAPSRVTRLAVNDGALYTRFRAGSTEPTPEMIARLRAFMADTTVDPSCKGPGRRHVEEQRVGIADLPAPPREPLTVINDINAVKGSALLLAGIQRLYAHIADRRGCSVEAAQILCNYSPAQIAIMAGVPA